MRKILILLSTISLFFGVTASPSSAVSTKVKIVKPSAPTIVSIVSSAPKNGKVNLKVTIALPASNGGSKITGSKVSAGSKSCTISKTKTSCTLKSIKNGKTVKVFAKSRNKKGFGSVSTKVVYVAGALSYPAASTAPVVPVDNGGANPPSDNTGGGTATYLGLTCVASSNTVRPGVPMDAGMLVIDSNVTAEGIAAWSPSTNSGGGCITRYDAKIFTSIDAISPVGTCVTNGSTECRLTLSGGFKNFWLQVAATNSAGQGVWSSKISSSYTASGDMTVATNDVPIFTSASSKLPSTKSGDIKALAGNWATGEPYWSPEGSRVLFGSYSNSLVVGDTNETSDIFIKDIVTGEMKIVSTSVDGTIGNGPTSQNGLSWSPDGTKIAFSSTATNLVPGANSGLSQWYVKDINTGIVIVASSSETGEPSSSGSGANESSAWWTPDGSGLSFASGSTNLSSLIGNGSSYAFLKNINTGAVTLLSANQLGDPANAPTYDASKNPFSPDGSMYMFSTDADNLVANDTNGTRDILIKVLSSGTVFRVNTTDTGAQVADSYGPAALGWSPSGLQILFGSGNNSYVSNDPDSWDLFSKNVSPDSIGKIVRVTEGAANSYGPGGVHFGVWNPTNSKVAFMWGTSWSNSNLYVWDESDNSTKYVNQGDWYAGSEPTWSPDGAWVTSSFGGFVYANNVLSTEKLLLNVTPANNVANAGAQGRVGFSPCNNQVAFSSGATDLVLNDTNGADDIFIYTM